jgi:hypothetical protein
MDNITQPWGDHRIKINGVYIGCGTVENANYIMTLEKQQVTGILLWLVNAVSEGKLAAVKYNILLRNLLVMLFPL